MSRLVAGCMTGTSIDSLDAALVRIEGKGMQVRAEFVRGVTRPLGETGAPLRRLAEQVPMTAGQIAALSREFTLLHAEALRDLIGPDRVDLVAVHGQTIFHAPPVTWQLLTPSLIAFALAAPVVFDLRAADIATGGEGAPITPLADWVLLRARESRAVVNLGGFCNVTMLPEDDDAAKLKGRDVCACNHLLDAVARVMLRQPYDEDGRHALEGAVHDEALEDLDGILRSELGGRRSLGTGDECAEWVSRWRTRVSPQDLAATACEGVGQEIAEAVQGVERILLAGGGMKNKGLTKAITSCCSTRVEPTDAHGVPATYREAACMAVLGALCQDRVPISLPAVTGVREPAPVAGVWVHP